MIVSLSQTPTDIRHWQGFLAELLRSRNSVYSIDGYPGIPLWYHACSRRAIKAAPRIAKFVSTCRRVLDVLVGVHTFTAEKNGTTCYTTKRHKREQFVPLAPGLTFWD